MRLGIAEFSLESVTFLPETTGTDVFEEGALRGPDVIAGNRGANTALGGFIDVCEAEGAAVQGIVAVGAGAAASASEEALARYTEEIVAGLDGLDGLLIHLHGALATPANRKADAHVLAAIRAAAGPDFPVACAMDLHGNLGPEVIEAANVVTGYHSSPHVDMAETGRRAARILLAAMQGRIRPVMAFAKPGIVLPSIFTATALRPLADIKRQAAAWQAREDALLDVSVFCGFAYADTPDTGMSVVAVADGDEALARRAADDLAEQCSLNRFRLLKRELVHSVGEGLEKAAAVEGGPVCLLEHADRMNDSTWTLRELLARDMGPAYAPFFCDPEAAAACAAAGTGARLKLAFGGKSSEKAGGPIEIEVEVLEAGDKRFRITGPLKTGTEISLGPSALIRAGRVRVSLVSANYSAIDLDCFSQFGLSPQDFRYILLRSKTHFREVYEPLCSAIVIVDTPDWGPADLTLLPYEYLPPETFPLDEGPPA